MSIASKRDEYKICFGFSYTPTVGPHKGQRVTVGPGEPVPDEILKDDDKLNDLVRRQHISVRGKDGDFQVSRHAIVLTEGQIEVLLKEGNDSDLNKLLSNPDVSRESLIRLHATAETRKLPRATLAKIEGASMR